MTGRPSPDGATDGRSVPARRALEALRAGVPNGDAVAALGSMQQRVEDRFSELLSAVDALPGSPAPGGMLIGGGFGSGKSHVLVHLAHVALSRGFVVSKVVISKETPLYDPVKVYRAAVEAARVPARPGAAVDEIAASIQAGSDAYAELYRWCHQEDAPVDSRFAATLFLLEYARGDEEFADRIVQFWAGDPLPVADLRRRLREAGAAPTYALGRLNERDLSVQRFRFLPRLAQAAGYRDDPSAPLTAVVTTVDDFETQVLVGKNDTELIPARLRAKGTAEAELLAGRAETGMRIIEREQVQLQPPGRAELDRSYAQLRRIHAEAYAWDPPDVVGLERLPSNRMRQYVRAWINEWDLRRLDPEHQPETTTAALAVDLSGQDDDPTAGDG